MATTGTTRNLPAFRTQATSTIVPLKMEPYESQFIIFRKNERKPVSAELSGNFAQADVIAELNGPWQVTFDPARQGPIRPVLFATLTDWTQSNNDSIKYYSGTAVYRISVKLPGLPSGGQIVLDLGHLTAMARVKVNGKVVGGVWTAPWQVDITSALRSGMNDLEISVVNNWMNRLIGDQKLPIRERHTWSPVIPYNADSPLQPSGLFGPVKVIGVNR